MASQSTGVKNHVIPLGRIMNSEQRGESPPVYTSSKSHLGPSRPRNSHASRLSFSCPEGRYVLLPFAFRETKL